MNQNERNIVLLGAPLHCGASQRGCAMGPEALRTAGLAETLASMGYAVEDSGDLTPTQFAPMPHSNPALRNLDQVAGWVDAIADAAENAALESTPIFLGGDHSMSAGSVAGIARAAAKLDRPVFVLWLDAHPDFHTLASTDSGNLHGTPMAYATGQSGFDGYFPPLQHAVPIGNICMMGLRSVDPAENNALADAHVALHDMRYLDEFGVVAPLRNFLNKVKAANGWLHVSLDVDFLDPTIAPGVGTTVRGGTTFREAHLIMELLNESGVTRSLDLVELNPFLDERGRTANLLVDLTASLFGRKVLDRKTQSL